MKKFLVVAMMLVVLVACGGTRAPSGPRVDRSLLTADEMMRAGSQDAFAAVQALRPHWLTTRGTNSLSSPGMVKVYLDGNLMGGPDFLRQITVTSIGSIRHLDGLEATQRYGLDHGEGAILVFTRRDSR